MDDNVLDVIRPKWLNYSNRLTHYLSQNANIYLCPSLWYWTFVCWLSRIYTCFIFNEPLCKICLKNPTLLFTRIRCNFSFLSETCSNDYWKRCHFLIESNFHSMSHLYYCHLIYSHLWNNTMPFKYLVVFLYLVSLTNYFLITLKLLPPLLKSNERKLRTS